LKKPRVSIWERRKGTLPPFKFLPTDKKYICQIYACRYTTPTFLHLRFGGNKEAISKRLRRLVDEGYLAKPRAQRSTRAHTEEICYAIGPKGLWYLRNEDPIYKNKRVSTKHVIETPKKERSWRNIDHQLGVVKFITCLRAACDEVGYKLYWPGQPALGKFTIRHSQKDSSRWPDAYFFIEFPGHPAGKNRAHYFLEYDRQTQSKMIRERCKDYYLWWMERLEEEKHRENAKRQRFRLPRRETWARFTNFYVLNVAVDPDRMLSLQHAAARVGKDAYHPRGWRSLRFTHDGLIDVAHPSTILGSIFYFQKDNNARQHKPVSMIPKPIVDGTRQTRRLGQSRGKTEGNALTL